MTFGWCSRDLQMAGRATPLTAVITTTDGGRSNGRHTADWPPECNRDPRFV